MYKQKGYTSVRDFFPTEPCENFYTHQIPLPDNLSMYFLRHSFKLRKFQFHTTLLTILKYI